MPVFVDTGAWFAYFVRRDADHGVATEWMRQNRQPLVTSDYVLDELFTLLKLRESHRVAMAGVAALLDHSVTRIEKVSDSDFAAARDVFERYNDKEWSFTDCTSKVIIERLGVTPAFAFDRHFDEFSTVIRVPARASS